MSNLGFLEKNGVYLKSGASEKMAFFSLMTFKEKLDWTFEGFSFKC